MSLFTTTSNINQSINNTNTWKSEINAREIGQLYSDIETIQHMKCDLDECKFCYYCNFAYRPAFFVYPTEDNTAYQPICIPCVAKYAFPNDTTMSVLRSHYNKEQLEAFVAQYYNVARYLIRTTVAPPLNILLISQTCATTPIYPLNKQHYSFNLSSYDAEYAEEA